MIRFFRLLPYHTKSAIQGLVRHSATAFSAISAVTMTLILMALFMLLTGNISSFTRNIESDFRIHVSIDAVQGEDDIAKLQEQVESIPGVKSVEFSDKDQELAKLKEENSEIFGMYEEGDANPMRDVFIIETAAPEDIEPVTATLNSTEGINKAEYGGDGVSVMVELFKAIRNGGFVFVGALSLLAVFLISNTIKMTIYARSTEIAIMRNVGATNGFIRVPFIIEGLVIGFIGAVLPCILTYFGYNYLYDILNGQFLSNMLIMQDVYPFALQICYVLLGCGVFVGMLGSFLAVSKYLRWKR